MACCDGGVTACSLRSVCRGLRDALRPYWFSTVMVNGYDTTAALLCELRTTAKRGQSPLVHLFMCDENPPIGRQNPLASMRRMYGERFDDALDDMREDEIEGGMFMAEVLQIAASTLRSVTLITNGTFSPGMGRIFGNTAFPHLDHIAVTAGNNIIFNSPTSFTPVMPSLRSAEFDFGGRDAIQSMAWIYQFAQYCPALDHVVLESFFVGSEMPSFLHVLYGPPPNVTVQDLLVVLRPTAVIDIRPYGSSASENPQLVAVRDHARVRFLSTAPQPPTYDFWKASWQARMKVSEYYGCLYYG
jgi:hypothetical protein